MATPAQRPVLAHSPLTGQIYIVTKYKVEAQAVVAERKFDVTDQFYRITSEHYAPLLETAEACLTMHAGLTPQNIEARWEQLRQAVGAVRRVNA